MKKILKWSAIVLGSLAVVILLIATLFLNLSPQFGGSPSEEQKVEYAQTGHYAEGIFLNDEEIQMEMNCHSITQMAKEMLSPDPRVAPAENIEVVSLDPESLTAPNDTAVEITWLGHSSFFIQMEGKNILLDPVFGQYASPHPMLGRKRFNEEMPITIDELPPIDLIIISHDHYDHLDYPSIDQLKAKTSHFMVPLGVGNHLRRWEIPEENITELDWWQEEDYEGLKIVFTPSRHMSGRGLTDQSSTLWGSWVLQGKHKNLYFSGDGGYGKHFAEIGEKYGPFDVGLMECGQYNELWADVHMMPEQTAQAGLDVGAKFVIPIHWGSFVLATHSWTDPIERVTRAAGQLGLPLATPRIGETVSLDAPVYPRLRWWEKYG